MAEFATERVVEWGDCDPAGIIWYPNYYRWMDSAFQELAAACGFSQRSLREDHGMVGTPLVDTGCRFESPAAHGDRLDVTVRVEKVGRSSLTLAYRFALDGRMTAEGFETRVFARPASGGGIVAAEIPQAAREALTAFAAAS